MQLLGRDLLGRNLLRRHLLLQGLSMPWLAALAQQPPSPGATPGTTAAATAQASPASAPALVQRPLQFPQDHGSHNRAQTEWWYLTGHVQDQAQAVWGFQLTFFRSRIASAQSLRSRLAAKHLLFAHAAVTHVQGGKLWHDQVLARWNGEPQADPNHAQASAALDNTDLRIGRWRLQRQADGSYHAEVATAQFDFALQVRPTQALLLQGQAGWSRKGPEPDQASFYYSQPQLATVGTLRVQQKSVAVEGRAWLDHEWSHAFLPPQAVGWDWVGFNLNNGAALTAFRLRRADGSTLWAGGSWRLGNQSQTFTPEQLAWRPLRHWTSPRSQARYPVAWQIDTPVGRFEVTALVDDQELDSQGSTGAIYWEGLSALSALSPTGQSGQSSQSGERLGLGYLEMTGYAQPLRL
jgi:predicted secreted hydrolase